MSDSDRMFRDPVSLGFDPSTLTDETDLPEEGVTLREVWKDPVARTLWLAIKARHLTSQHFRKQCLQFADGLRKNPPPAPGAIHSLPEVVCYATSIVELRRQLWPYIVRALIDDGAWGVREETQTLDQKVEYLKRKVEYLEKAKELIDEDGDLIVSDKPEELKAGAFVPWIIPRGIPDKQLRWVYRQPEDKTQPHPWRTKHYRWESLGFDWQRYQRCSLCGGLWFEMIHVEGPVL